MKTFLAIELLTFSQVSTSGQRKHGKIIENERSSLNQEYLSFYNKTKGTLVQERG